MSQPVAPQLGGNPFGRRTTIALVALGLLSFITAIVLGILGGDIGGSTSAGADTSSRSAIGHRAFLRVLQRLKIPTVVSRYDSSAKAGREAVLVLAEPAISLLDGPRIGKILDKTPNLLVVLPKWRGRPSGTHVGWLEGASLHPRHEVEQVLDKVGCSANIVRLPPLPATAWTNTGSHPVPDIEFPQLMRNLSDGMTPIISSPHGVLVARVHFSDFPEGKMLVVSDPDLISNHGLGRGDNAVIAVGLLERLRGKGGAVIFDETLHGFEERPSLWRSLFEFPLVLATVQVLLAVLVLSWAATRRFGAPLPVGIGIEPGKEFLVDNTAALLHFGGHAAHMLERYLHSTLRHVGDRLHAPDTMDAQALQRWLERVGAARRVSVDLVGLISEIKAVAGAGSKADPRAVVLAGNRLYRWKKEILDGSTARK